MGGWRTEGISRNITIVVPENIAAYEKAMNDYIFGDKQGMANPSLTWKFVSKQVSIPQSADIMKASAEAASTLISTQGGSASARVAYLKIVNGTTYVLLGMHLDGWAGVSASIAKIEPLVEKTLLQFPEIKSVKFEVAPGDNEETILNSYKRPAN